MSEKPEYFVPPKQAEKLLARVTRELEGVDPEWNGERHAYLRGMREVLTMLLGKVGTDTEDDEDGDW